MKFKLYANNTTTDITFGSAEDLAIFAFNKEADVDFCTREIFIGDDYYTVEEYEKSPKCVSGERLATYIEFICDNVICSVCPFSPMRTEDDCPIEEILEKLRE